MSWLNKQTAGEIEFRVRGKEKIGSERESAAAERDYFGSSVDYPALGQADPADRPGRGNR